MQPVPDTVYRSSGEARSDDFERAGCTTLAARIERTIQLEEQCIILRRPTLTEAGRLRRRLLHLVLPLAQERTEALQDSGEGSEVFTLKENKAATAGRSSTPLFIAMANTEPVHTAVLQYRA